MQRTNEATASLRRELGVLGSVGMGLGSILGTGVFVSIGIAAGIAGPAMIPAIAIAGVVATCNALNSAQLAAALPTSGGTYAYGYRFLHPTLGFTAGWMFLWAKSASAATAALGFSGYLLNAAGADGRWLLIGVALAGVVALTALVIGGLKRSNVVNLIVVGITIAALLGFVVAGIPATLQNGADNLWPFLPAGDGSLGTHTAVLRASALMFVAYTGYGRIATLGEEVRQPAVTIPRAIIVTVAVSMLLYMAVGTVGVASVGADAFARATADAAAPLEVIARGFGVPGLPVLLAVGAITAMLGVLLNLILGLSRMLFAMGRQGDMPGVFGRIAEESATPRAAVLMVGGMTAALVLLGDVRTTWSFSAFTVLIYYSVTNLSALALPAEVRLYPKAVAWIGLACCLVLAFFVEPAVWGTGLGLIAVGLLWHSVAKRFQARGRGGDQSNA
jgi:APA family basic amino acid/polyamine antiporter